MRKFLSIIVLSAFSFLYGCHGHATGSAENKGAPPDGMGRQVEQYLADASVTAPKGGRLMAIVIPEGTSPDAQEVAAYGFKALQGMHFDAVLLVGQSHGAAFGGASVYSGDDFQTPFGPLRIDRELAGRFIDPAAGVLSNPDVTQKEYAGDFVLAFIKRVLGDCKVVPLLIGNPGQNTYDRLTALMATAATKHKTRVLLVAMSDLAKGAPDDAVRKMDAETMELLESLRTGETMRQLRSREAELSGGHAVLMVMESVRLAGADMGEAFHYTTDKGPGDQVTGHAALGFYDRPLDDVERIELLKLAWRSVEAAALGKQYEPHLESPRLLASGAAFVTLENNHRLRGGMGQVQASGPLYKSVISSARAAATKDDRFPPVTVGELDEISYEVSVLTPLVPVLDVRKDIELGTHGLYLRLNGNSGMLLPQVPVEQRWDLDEYLRQISLRAGLPPDAWKDQDAHLWTFTTEIVR